MKFLQVYKTKQNHTNEEFKLFNKIKNYEKLIQKMVKFINFFNFSISLKVIFELISYG